MHMAALIVVLSLSQVSCGHGGFAAMRAVTAVAMVATVLAVHDAHHHSHHCGHEYTYVEDRPVYYYEGRWEYYDNESGHWYYYDDTPH